MLSFVQSPYEHSHHRCRCTFMLEDCSRAVPSADIFLGDPLAADQHAALLNRLFVLFVKLGGFWLFCLS
jgi:hypothetical protein